MAALILLGSLYLGSAPISTTVNVTDVSKANGQFWSANARNWSVSFAGL